MPEINSHTVALDAARIKKLRAALEARGFEFRDVPHAHFGAGRDKVQVAAYHSGKVVVQGKGTREFVEFVLEPEVTGVAEIGYEKVRNPERYEPHIGVDESGKGDFFGPLVIAGVFADAAALGALVEGGVRDSKTVTSDKRIGDLARMIRRTPGVESDVIVLSPARYNELQAKMRSVNEVLGWGHACVIENLLERMPACPRAVSDQFARTEWTVRKRLGPRGRAIVLEQRHKAESDPAVAAASILARDRFVRSLRDMSVDLGVRIPPGASAAVKALARELLQKHGALAMEQHVKTHFKTWSEIGGAAG